MFGPPQATKRNVDTALNDEQVSPPNPACEKRAYEKPVLVVHGSVGELTQSGGNRHHDGVLSRKLS